MALFEWDEKKNKTNAEKHGIQFEAAKRVFDDPDRVQYILKDYEYTTLSSATWIILANMTIILNRIPSVTK
jgi:uncharacterized DUF497 family protein